LLEHGRFPVVGGAVVLSINPAEWVVACRPPFQERSRDYTMGQQAEQTLCVKDVMTTRPISVRASATPRELARVLTEHEISGVPVVDERKRVVGVVSKTDLLQWCVKGGLGFGATNLLTSLAEGGAGTRFGPVDLGIVADFMTIKPLTAAPDESLGTIAHRMAEYRVHRLIVTDSEGRLKGIVTSMDLLRAFPPGKALGAS
jgi:CBS domain-containing protein